MSTANARRQRRIFLRGFVMLALGLGCAVAGMAVGGFRDVARWLPIAGFICASGLWLGFWWRHDSCRGGGDGEQ